MKALLLKDWLIMKSQYRFYLLLFLFMGGIGLVTGTGYLNAYCMIIISTISTNMLQNDENCRWLIYADTTPLKRKQVVGEKYVINLLLLGAACLMMALFRLTAGGIHGNLQEAMEETLAVICLFTAVITMMTGVTFPLLFRWGTMKGRMIALAVYGGVAGLMAAGYVGMALQWFVGGAPIQIPVLAGIAAVCLLVVYPLSYLLAVRWYERRELA